MAESAVKSAQTQTSPAIRPLSPSLTHTFLSVTHTCFSRSMLIYFQLSSFILNLLYQWHSQNPSTGPFHNFQLPILRALHQVDSSSSAFSPPFFFFFFHISNLDLMIQRNGLNHCPRVEIGFSPPCQCVGGCAGIYQIKRKNPAAKTMYQRIFEIL